MIAVYPLANGPLLHSKCTKSEKSQKLNGETAAPRRAPSLHLGSFACRFARSTPGRHAASSNERLGLDHIFVGNPQAAACLKPNQAFQASDPLSPPLFPPVGPIPSVAPRLLGRHRERPQPAVVQASRRGCRFRASGLSRGLLSQLATCIIKSSSFFLAPPASTQIVPGRTLPWYRRPRAIW